MFVPTSAQPRAGTLTRRRLLTGLATTGAAAAGLTACQVHTSDPTPAKEGTALAFPDPAGPLPADDTKIQILSGGPGPKSGFFEALVKAYHAKHPNITLQYNELPNAKIAETLPLQLRSGKAPDLFLVTGVPISELVSAGQVANLSQVIPEWDKLAASFPFGAIVPGVEVFDDNPYCFPFSDSLRSNLLLYNSDYLKKADLNPAGEPFTWDEFRAAAKKLTKQGNGDYYGLIMAATIGDPLGEMDQYAGGAGNAIDWKTGQYAFDSDEMVELFELFLALKADKSLVPGWASLKHQEARARMAQGAAGMMLQGPWNFPVWGKQNPDFNYGVALMPLPTKDTTPYATYSVGGANWFAVYAKSEESHQQVAGDILHWMGTEEGQSVWGEITGAGTAPFLPQARAKLLSGSGLDAPNKTALKIFEDTLRLAPSPLIANPDNAQVNLAMKKVTPGLPDILGGLMTGQLRNPKKQLTDLNRRSEKALDDAIARAGKKGAKVSRDDWKFPNWDRTKSYVEEDYQQ